MSNDRTTVNVLINGLSLTALQYSLTKLSADGKENQRLLSLDFVITGGQQYHDVTSTLYEPTVAVSVPEHNVQFQARVHNYFTSVPRLETATDTVDVHLELIETSA
ncbi:DUF3219 family protein [Paenibacillus campi]|uniref:DUF3219 family protein n=1 Tax=Paenibacillus campi TaxID=3106031 RepID=UPI002AFEC7F3|nr:DUF3219 family protein [Paenibacillus sp. SGZ-1014]